MTHALTMHQETLDHALQTLQTQQPGASTPGSGGTLLLDELSDLTASSQANVLRLLERSDTSRTRSVRSSIRLVATTSQNLDDDAAFAPRLADGTDDPRGGHDCDFGYAESVRRAVLRGSPRTRHAGIRSRVPRRGLGTKCWECGANGTRTRAASPITPETACPSRLASGQRPLQSRCACLRVMRHSVSSSQA